jgi:molecular chaperone GrpE
MDNPKDKTPAEAIEITGQESAAENGLAGQAPSPAAETAPGAAAGLDACSQKLKQEKQDLYDRLLRKQAELDNFRKRVQREKEEFLQHATADLIRALLPVLDGFERALAHRDSSTPEQFSQGVELIYRELLETLNRAGVHPIETEGKTFDPHLHQAVETVESPGHRDQEIVEELQRGYRLRNRLLRPAIVKVAVEGKRKGEGAKPQ